MYLKNYKVFSFYNFTQVCALVTRRTSNQSDNNNHAQHPLRIDALYSHCNCTFLFTIEANLAMGNKVLLAICGDIDSLGFGHTPFTWNNVIYTYLNPFVSQQVLKFYRIFDLKFI